MSVAAAAQNSFAAGELSPLMLGRQDVKEYAAGLRTNKNGLLLAQGAWTRRPGTYYVGTTKLGGTRKSCLIPFKYSTVQAYIVELGHLHARFYANDGTVESSPGVPLEIVTPYDEGTTFEVNYTQSADTMYLVHETLAPRQLVRTSATAFALSTLAFRDGPYLATNTTATTLTASATTGSVTVTASSATGINNNAGFQTTDVGRHIRTLVGSTWGWGIITARASATSVTVSVQSAFGGTGATTAWRLGLWSDTTGYPSSVAFFEDRLVFGGSTAEPQRLDMSNSGDYLNFAPSTTGGTVTDSHAIPATLNSNEVNVIRWLQDDEKGLLVGTSGAEWLVRASTQGEVLTPTNRSAKPSTHYGSSRVRPVRASRAVLFTQETRRRLRELVYSLEVDGFRAPDVSFLAEHIMRPGVTQMTFQQEPQPIMWACREDGTLLSFSYDREHNAFGWGRHVIGGVSNVYGAPAKVESVATIPSTDGTRDQVWVVTQRFVGGAVVRHVEFIQKLWEVGDAHKDAFYLDAGLTYDGVPTMSVTGLTHLEGQTVSIMADGKTHPDRTVASGTVALDVASSVVHVGYSYVSDGATMPIEAGARNGTAQGKLKKINRLGLWLLDTLGLKIGLDEDTLHEVFERDSGDPIGQAVPLFTGVKRESLDSDYDRIGQVFWRADTPQPATVLAVFPVVACEDDS